MNDISVIAAYFQAMQTLGGQIAHDPGSVLPNISGAGSLPSAFPVTAFATASIASASQALANYMQQRFGARPATSVDRRLASFWFGSSLRPQGWQLPAVRDPVTGDYPTRDGWIRLHANAPHHQAAALAVLGVNANRNDVARVMANGYAAELESAIVQGGGCAAMMRSRQEWAAHPQGQAVQAEPLFHIEEAGPGPTSSNAAATLKRPLKGIKILDLTRVLAGPVSTRYLAAYGAQVLRIDPPFWTEPGMVPEVTLGKRCAMLDLRLTNQLERFKILLSQADVMVHGYRADALERLGLGAQARQALRPGLIDICLDAYGWTGPWHTRRGFDSLVQMSNGIANAGMHYFGQERPAPLPVQALDQASGYLMAAAAVRGLTHRLQTERGSIWRLSLARTGELLVSLGTKETSTTQHQRQEARPEPESAADYAAGIEHTDWGQAQRLKTPCEIEGVPMHWDHPAGALRSSLAQWET